MTVAFKKAVKTESKLRLALAGISGSGKTYTAIRLASLLADGRPVAVIDTERGSASKYADLFAFDVLELERFHPDAYIEAIQAASAAGYAVVVIDSLSHAWNGTGGLLELHEQVVKRQKTANSYTAWAEITPLQNKLINAITGANLHVIATMRSKQEYVQNKDERGQTQIKKVGMAAVQREGMEYEFDIFGEMDGDHNLIIQKTRCPALSEAVIAKPGEQVATILRDWLHGAPAAPQAAPAPSPTVPAEAPRPTIAKLQAIVASLCAEHGISKPGISAWMSDPQRRYSSKQYEHVERIITALEDPAIRDEIHFHDLAQSKTLAAATLLHFMQETQGDFKLTMRACWTLYAKTENDRSDWDAAIANYQKIYVKE